jgi:hypothetical protein
MKQVRLVMLSTLLVLCGLSGQAQQSLATATDRIVPPLVNFSGVLTGVEGKLPAGAVEVTFSLYREQQGGDPLWLETQSIAPDLSGHYTVMLGSTTIEGIPADIFASDEAHWLAVQVSGQAEQPRVLLVSAPYALKAGDAETLGGLPASAFVLATAQKGAGSTASKPAGANGSPKLALDVTTAAGTASYVPLWDSTSDITSSVLFQSGTGSTAMIGIDTATPASTLDVNGSVNAATSFNIGGTPFDFGSPLAGNGTGGNSFLGFAGNQTTTGNSNVGAGWAALLKNTTGAANTAVGEAALTSNTVEINNTALGDQALAANGTGDTNDYASYNTAVGASAAASNTLGEYNSALGFAALWANTGATAPFGAYNTAMGAYSLAKNITGSYNTAVGAYAGPVTAEPDLPALSNTTAIGFGATVSGDNSTAIGYGATASDSNAIVLGGVGSYAVNVGIGTATPQYTLDVHGNANFTGNVTFAPTQTFPGGSGSGTVTSVTAGLGLLGGTITSTGTLSINPAAIPQLFGANTFTGNQTVAGNVTATGEVTATAGYDIEFGGQNWAFGFGSPGSGSGTGSAYLGFAGSPRVAGTSNVGVGWAALFEDSTGSENTAIGKAALNNNAKESYNTAVGFQALLENGIGDAGVKAEYNTAVGAFAAGSNTTGGFNTAVGDQAAGGNTTGGSNTALGYEALSQNTTGGANTAVGTNAGPKAANLSDTTAVGSGASAGGFGDTTIGAGASAASAYNTAVGYAAVAAGPNSTAIGYNATASTPESLALGANDASIPGKYWVNVGVGTAAPRSEIEAAGSVAKGLGPTITLTNSAGGGDTSTSLDFNSYEPSTRGTYNPAARILVEDAGQYSDNIYFQSNVPTAPNNKLQTNMEITSEGKVLIGGNFPTAIDRDLLSISQIYPPTAKGHGPQAQYFDTDTAGIYGFQAVRGSKLNGGTGLSVWGGDGDASTATSYGGEGISAHAGCGGGSSGCADAGFFDGNVEIEGTLNGTTPAVVKIDDPIDAANKYLVHSSVQSSERMDIYTGNVTTDGGGLATVQLPEWFEALNSDFRYQLTVIGQFAQAIVSSKVAEHRFGIRTDKPNVEVSWQITAVRQDAYAKAHPLVVEQAKDERERGYYLDPDAYGASEQQNIEWARHPEMMRRLEIMRAGQSAGDEGEITADRDATLPLAVPPAPKVMEPQAQPMPAVAPIRPVKGPRPTGPAALPSLAAPHK